MDVDGEERLEREMGWGVSQVALVLKSLPANAGDTGDVGLILRSGRPPGGGYGNPL